MNTKDKKMLLGDDAMAGMLLTGPESSSKSKSEAALKGKKSGG